ncbi:hypothetical protein SELMODRAFT_407487 [Selaginella moellendorffii]|uniref:GDSL esterase/lipase n=1 Tax=Selaginella moellendorffii TaxID=88036 RepID=D8R5S0_SELML|nr:hypothetical protein SELMODRAFT_407487 [Selaginella moellendorffii]
MYSFSEEQSKPVSDGSKMARREAAETIRQTTLNVLCHLIPETTSSSSPAFRPNGIDFPGGKATGRFCNGFTVVDLIAQELGLPLVPAYHDPNTKGSVILKGVSYASGGARILNDSSVNFLQNIQQIQNFVNTRSEIVLLVGGEDPAFDLLSRSIFLFALGSNNYLNYMNSTRSKSPQEFQDEVISAYKGYLNWFLLLDHLVAFHCNILGANGKACHEEANTLAVNFDRALKDMVSGMNRDMNGAKMVFGTTYDLFYDATNNLQNMDQFVLRETNTSIGMLIIQQSLQTVS